jgi:hypothetical protein
MLCPVECKYCMASKIDQRSKYWNNGSRIGINKSCIFINRVITDKPLKESDIDFTILEGDVVGFQGITDCFWNVFYDDLKFLVDNLDNFKIKKLVLTTKMPVTDDIINLIKGKRVLVVYSLTGLDFLEKTSTRIRLNSIEKLLKNNIDVFPIIHPYIHNISDISFFLPKLQELGIKQISFKGFRYNPNNMKELEKYIPIEILKQYDKNEEEVLLGKEFLKNEIKKYNLEYIDLKEYIYNSLDNIYSFDEKLVREKVKKIVNDIVISSSEKNLDTLIDYVVKRRTK